MFYQMVNKTILVSQAACRAEAKKNLFTAKEALLFNDQTFASIINDALEKLGAIL